MVVFWVVGDALFLRKKHGLCVCMQAMLTTQLSKDIESGHKCRIAKRIYSGRQVGGNPLKTKDKIMASLTIGIPG